MRKFWFAMTLAVSTAVFFGFSPQRQEAQENYFANLESITAPQRPPQINPPARSSEIKNIQVFGENSGAAFTRDALFRTADDGANWREIVLPKSDAETISAVSFLNENIGWTILADQQNARLDFLKTADGGNSWTRNAMNLRAEDLAEANLETISLEVFDAQNVKITLRLQSSSNFIRRAIYRTDDGGQNWNLKNSDVSTPSEYHAGLRESELTKIAAAAKLPPNENIIENSFFSENAWILTASGSCAGFKTGCVQETRIRKISDDNANNLSTKEITPPQIVELAAREKANAQLQAENSVFAQPPGGATRLSLNRGFDKCTAATVAQMQAWWNNSPFYDANIYISGRNRGCSQPQLTANWITQVSAQGWGFIPTIVGYQAPCSVSTNSVKHSSDPAVAEQQGRGEADIAISDAANLGLTQGTVLYYDMERYDDLSGTGACSTPVKAFLKGWTERLHEQGYISGVYGSPFNAQGDWINIPEASRMDVVWLARWNNIMSVWGVAPLPDTFWTNHQRIHQWLGPRDETWGGVTFNIDNNISDAPVAGAPAAKNKPADFDGDGKTDISVFRPDAGGWYVVNSSNSAFRAVNFGTASDILAPGDYDGDGKTDYAVFRPSDGTWYIQLRTTLRVQQFGASGDIPVSADYNGDGYTDIAVFRPSSGAWYILNSSGSPNLLRVEQFGANGDKPVQADYDGDGKTDLAVFRPADGGWYLLRSQLGFTAAQFGIASDKPVQADYDGDGKADLGVYRDGVWYLLQSQQGFAAVQFGVASDKPAPGDYDGDGKSDLGVFREGIWYLLRSTAGFTGVQFGAVGDRTIPAAYIPQN